MNDYKLVLEHHGIKGQKWGVRRFQNEDGTRTAAGKKRYKSRYVGDDGYLTNRGKRKMFREFDKVTALQKDTSRVTEKFAGRASKKADKLLSKANESEIGSDREKRLMKKYKTNIEYARQMERGEAAVDAAREYIGDVKIKSWTDPNAKNSQAYKDAKKIVAEYGRAHGMDVAMTYGIGKTNRAAALYRIGGKTNKKPKYGYNYGDSVLV